MSDRRNYPPPVNWGRTLFFLLVGAVLVMYLLTR